MAIKKTNKRIMITLSKKQVAWIEKLAKQTKLTKSNLIKWLVSKNVEVLIEYIYRKENDLTNDEIYRIIKTSWLDDDY
jgi:hypothetical protein